MYLPILGGNPLCFRNVKLLIICNTVRLLRSPKMSTWLNITALGSPPLSVTLTASKNKLSPNSTSDTNDVVLTVSTSKLKIASEP